MALPLVDTDGDFDNGTDDLMSPNTDPSNHNCKQGGMPSDEDMCSICNNDTKQSQGE